MNGYPYIDLCRRFLEISGSTSIEVFELAKNDATSLWATLSTEEQGKSWNEILENDISVILGTSGSGKTTELREKVRALCNEDQNAFLLRTEALQEGRIHGAFDPFLENQAEVFDAWLRSGNEGILFIDALDEARLPSGKNDTALENALQTISSKLGRRKAKVRLVISSRPSEWRGEADIDRLKQFIKRIRQSSQDANEQEFEIGTFKVAPLSDRNVRQLCDSRKVNSDCFIDAVNKTLSVELIQQPLDAHFFLDVWENAITLKRGHLEIFNSRHQVMNDLVNWRLTAQNDGESRSNLDPTRARQAAGKLAAFVIISGKLDLTHETNVNTTKATSVLTTDVDPWTPLETRQLLSCGLFQPSIGGCIRFTHNELRDFLAAEFFDRNMRERANSIAAINPLLAEGLQTTTIPQSTERTFGWMAKLNDCIKAFCIEVRPTLLLEAGDPKALSLADRESILRNHAKLYEKLKYRGEWFAHIDIQRIAVPELSCVVSELLENSSSPELSHLLIDVVRLGKMSDLAGQLAKIVTAKNSNIGLKGDSCAALIELEDQRFRKEVLSAAIAATPPDQEDTDTSPDWNKFQINALRYAFEVASFCEIVKILKRVERERSNYFSLTSQMLIDACEKLSPDKKCVALKVLVKLIFQGREQNRYQTPVLSPRYQRFLPAITYLATELIQNQTIDAGDPSLLDAVEMALTRATLTDSFSPIETSMKLVKILRARVDIKRSVTDRRIAMFLESQPNRGIPFDAFSTLKFNDRKKIGSIFSSEDVEFYCEQAARPGDEASRMQALELADCVLNSLTGQDTAKALAIYQRNAKRFGNQELRRRFGIYGRVARFKTRLRYQYWYEFQSGFEARIDRVKSSYSRVTIWLQFKRNKKPISSGEISQYAKYLWNISPDDLGSGTIAAIQKKFGAGVSSNFEEGLRNYWKKNDTSYSSKNLCTSYLGLAGVNLDESIGNLPEDAELVRKAFRYSFSHLNGFPNWVDALAKRFPDEFCIEMEIALRIDFSSEELEQGNHTSDCINKLAYSSAEIRAIVAPTIFKLLKGQLPNNRLDRMLYVDIIARSQTINEAEVTPFLINGFKDAWIGFDFRDAWFWLNAVLNVNSVEGLKVLKQHFGDLTCKGQKALFFEYLARGRNEPSLNADEQHVRDQRWTDPHLLEWLVCASFLAWPPENDEKHEGVFSPNKKDRASSIRQNYSNKLGALHSNEALDALHRLSNLSELSNFKNIFLFMIEQMKCEAGKRREYSSEDTILFLNKLSKKPKTVKEFRSICKGHIETVLENLHQSDDDEGAFFRRGEAKEDDLRNWLSARLRSVGERFYTVTREQEVAGSRRPDLYLHSKVDGLGKIPVEIKLADMGHWSGDELVKTPKDQLAGQYLLESSSHTGIYVLVNAAKPREKEVNVKTNCTTRMAFRKKVGRVYVNFIQLVDLVKIECDRLNEEFQNSKCVLLVARDISEKPLTGSRASAE